MRFSIKFPFLLYNLLYKNVVYVLGITRYGVSFNFYRLLKEETVSPKHPASEHADAESDHNNQAWLNKTSSDSAFSRYFNEQILLLLIIKLPI